MSREPSAQSDGGTTVAHLLVYVSADTQYIDGCFPRDVAPKRFSNQAYTAVKGPPGSRNIALNYRKAVRIKVICRHFATNTRRIAAKIFSGIRPCNCGVCLTVGSQAQIDCTRSRAIRASPLRTIANLVAIGPIISYSTTADSTMVEITE